MMVTRSDDMGSASTLYAVTSTVRGSGDQGADPNQLVAITDGLGFTTATQAAGEDFAVIDAATCCAAWHSRRCRSRFRSR